MTTYSEEVSKAICARLATGETMANICRDPDMPSEQAVYDWKRENKDFALALAEARQIGFDVLAEGTLDIAEGRNPVNVPGDVPATRDKLRIWTRMQLLARWDPTRYGDNVQVRHANAAGDGDAVLNVKGNLLDGLKAAMAKTQES